MINLLIKWILNAVILMVAANFVKGVEIKNFWTALGVALILGLLNAFLKPILEFLSFPLLILSLGLFSIVINTIIIVLTSYFVEGFNVANFFSAMLFAIILSIFSWILNIIF